jgi:predicted phosphodiesterase
MKDIDYIIFTGDLVHHGDWDTSETYSREMMTYIMDTLRVSFPGKQIFPVFGNNDPFPKNTYALLKLN